MSTTCRSLIVLSVVVTTFQFSSGAARAQSCPAPLAEARRLVLVTAPTMSSVAATMRLYERASASDSWHPLSDAQPATIGRAGMAWSQFFMRLAHPGEPVKVEGDKRSPAGLYSIGRSFGILASSRANYLRVAPDTVCVDDPASSAYNVITSRNRVEPRAHAERMGEVLPMYRRGLVVNYPTDAKRRAGSCIFIHVWRSPTSGTAGCIAVPEPRVEALQEFAEHGAALAILPHGALDRLKGCLPQS